MKPPYSLVNPEAVTTASNWSAPGGLAGQNSSAMSHQVCEALVRIRRRNHQHPRPRSRSDLLGAADCSGATAPSICCCCATTVEERKSAAIDNHSETSEWDCSQRTSRAYALDFFCAAPRMVRHSLSYDDFFSGLDRHRNEFNVIGLLHLLAIRISLANGP